MAGARSNGSLANRGKAAAMERRSQATRRSVEVAPSPADGSTQVLVSADGALTFSLKTLGDGLFVQRTQRGREGAVAIQCLVIRAQDDFRRWCDMEPTRFEHPVVFDRLRRYGDEVFTR